MLSREQLIELLKGADVHFEVDQEEPFVIYSNGQIEKYEETQLPSGYLSNLNQSIYPKIKTKVSIEQINFEFFIKSKLGSNSANIRNIEMNKLGDAAWA